MENPIILPFEILAELNLSGRSYDAYAAIVPPMYNFVIRVRNRNVDPRIVSMSEIGFGNYSNQTGRFVINISPESERQHSVKSGVFEFEWQIDKYVLKQHIEA